jgi:hypothetical protein
MVDFASRAWGTGTPDCSFASTFDWFFGLSAFFMVATVCEIATKMQILFTILFTSFWRAIRCAKGDGRHLWG